MGTTLGLAVLLTCGRGDVQSGRQYLACRSPFVEDTGLRLTVAVILLVVATVAVAEAADTYEGKGVEHWREQLRTGSPGERIRASHALSEIGTAASPAVDVLTAALEDPNEYVRRNSANALARIGPAASLAVEKLARGLKDWRGTDLRTSAARALGGIGPAAKAAVPDLIQALSDADSLVGEEAASALGRIGTPLETCVAALMRHLNDSNLYVRRAASRALGRLGPGAVPALVDGLTHSDAQARYRAAEALGSIGAPAVSTLTEALRASQPVAREAAARAFVYMRGVRFMRPTEPWEERAVPALIGVLDDAEPNVRLWATRALGQIGPKSAAAVEPLIRRLTEDDYYLRYEAVLALARIGTAAVPRLVETLHAPSSRVRAGAARAIGYVSPPPEDAVAPLVMALQDADADVRYFAADALAGADTLPHLTLLLEDEKPAMRIGAAYALGRRPWRWNPASRESGSSAYAVTMVRALAKALQDEDVQVRRVAAESLAYFGTNPSADVSTPGLKEAMRDVDPTVRFRAAKALAAILRKRKDPEEKPEAYEAESQRVADSSPIAHYYGFADDLKIMRLTFESEGPPSIWSPGEAQSAAFRVFRNTPLVGLTKKEALQLLGDPIRMSQFDERARSDPDTPLQYKFDNGYGGTEYTLHFKDGRLTRIEVRGFA